IEGDMLPYEIALASNGEVVTLATRHLAEEILAGGPVTVRYTPNFTEAQEFFLNNTSGVFYMDALGLGVPMVTGLAFMGPAIGNIFEDMVDELDSTAPPSTPRLLAQGGDIIDAVRAYLEFTHSMAVTAATNEQGSLVIRFSGITD
ncbi:MAG: hypothetical protein D6712_18055, partial [Chloroflexi bacterium]